jgi:hypothetical protein
MPGGAQEATANIARTKPMVMVTMVFRLRFFIVIPFV